jgi:hypothetical protein
MSAIRGVKDRRFKFTQIINNMFEDSSISLKAKGFIGYCLTKPESWKFHVSYLSQQLKEGEKAIYSTIDECIENGYAIRYQKRKENGDFSEWETIISDSKFEIAAIKEELKNDPDFQKTFTDRCFGDAQSAVAQNASHSNIVNTSNIKEKQQQEGAVAPAPQPASAAAAENSRESDVIYKTSRGDTKKLSQSEIYRHFAKSVYSTDIIKQAVKHMQETMEIVNSPLKLLESICKRLAQNPKAEIKSKSEKMESKEEKKQYTIIRANGETIYLEKKKKESPNV